MDVPEDPIVDCVMSLLDSLPHHGKPIPHREWTVVAALVATTTTASDASNNNNNNNNNNNKANTLPWVISLATGTKCTTHRHQGCILHDCHAEVLVRRGLMRVLWHEIQMAMAGGNHHHPRNHHHHPQQLRLLEQVDNHVFQLKSNLQIHLYVSDTPCGDASIYKFRDNDATATTPQFTGAKLVVSTSEMQHQHQQQHPPPSVVSLVEGTGGGTTTVTVVREEKQFVGRLRTKSARSTIINRSQSMSCSDKLVKWTVLGLQGRALMKFIPQPIRLSSVVVSHDPRSTVEAVQSAVRRAIPDRVAAVQQILHEQQQSSSSLPQQHAHDVQKFLQDLVPPHVSISQRVFSGGKAAAAAAAVADFATTPLRASSGMKRKRRNDDITPPPDTTPSKLSPCGYSINWIVTESSPVEVVIGARGIRQGKKPRNNNNNNNDDDNDNDALLQTLQSRLSRQSLAQLAHNYHASTDETSSSYQSWKQLSAGRAYASVHDVIVNTGPLAGWIVDRSDDFTLPSS